jgi:hypothetical protein
VSELERIDALREVLRAACAWWVVNRSPHALQANVNRTNAALLQACEAFFEAK